MKRYMVLLLAFVLAFSMIGIGTASAIGPDEPNEASGYCALLADEHPTLFNHLFDSHGDCVSFFNANNFNTNQNGLVLLAKVLAELTHKPVGYYVSMLHSY